MKLALATLLLFSFQLLVLMASQRRASHTLGAASMSINSNTHHIGVKLGVAHIQQVAPSLNVNGPALVTGRVVEESAGTNLCKAPFLLAIDGPTIWRLHAQHRHHSGKNTISAYAQVGVGKAPFLLPIDGPAVGRLHVQKCSRTQTTGPHTNVRHRHVLAAVARCRLRTAANGLLLKAGSNLLCAVC